MKAKVALIRDDFTWSEAVIKTGGVNFSQASANALANMRLQLGFYDTGEYPENIIAMHVLEVWKGKANV